MSIADVDGRRRSRMLTTVLFHARDREPHAAEAVAMVRTAVPAAADTARGPARRPALESARRAPGRVAPQPQPSSRVESAWGRAAWRAHPDIGKTPLRPKVAINPPDL